LLQGEGGGLIPSDIAYATGDQLISGVKTFQTGIIIRAGFDQLNFKTGDAGFTGSITMPTIGGNRTYTIPDVTSSTADFVLNTGEQFVGGLKKFITRPTVNGTGVLLIGEAQSSVLPSTLVYINDTQAITAAKTFNAGLTSPVGITGANLVYNTGNQTITGQKTLTDHLTLQGINNQLRFKTGAAGNTLNINVPTITASHTYTIPDVGNSAAFVLNSGTQNIGGIKTFTDRAIFNQGISSSDGITGTNLVYNTGDQTIDGVKQFKELSIVNTAGDARLEIGGTSNVYIDLKKPNTDDYDFRIATDAADAVLTTSSGSLNFNISGINRLHLNKDGKIGIGTTNPSQLLDVNGTILSKNLLLQGDSTNGYIRTTNASSNLYLGSNNTNHLTILSSGNVEIDSRSTILNLKGSTDQYNGISFSMKDASNSVVRSSFIDVRNENNITVSATIADVSTDGSADYYISTTTAGSRTTDRRAERLRIKGNGNVGIGNSSPTSKLNVAGEITSDGLGGSDGNIRMIGGSYGVFFRNDGSNFYFLSTAFGNPTGSWNTSRPLTYDLAEGSIMLGGSQNTGGIYVKTNGTVGIGTSFPINKLHVVGNSYINGTLSGDTASFGLTYLNRTDSSTEGGELILKRANDNADLWHIDVNGTGNGPDLRIFANTGPIAIAATTAGQVKFTQRPTVGGTGVLLQGEASAAPTNLVTNLGSTSGIYSLGQAAYDALTKLPNVLYIITGV
jgi:hypothetical protein